MDHGSHEGHACCHPEKPKAWHANKLFVISAAALVLLGLSFILPSFEPFRKTFVDYLRLMAWPVAIGFFFGGLIDYYVPQEYISKYLAQNRKSTILYASGLGFLMSACSHGILALSMELHKKGASGPAVVSFLLASPWANLPITFLLIGFFGAKGFLIIFAALWVSISTGIIFQTLDQKNLIEKNKHSVAVASDFSIREDIAKRIRQHSFDLRRDLNGIIKGMAGLADMVLGWVLIGIVLASLASAFVPHDFFEKFMGPSLKGLALTLVAATLFEVCSEGTSPLAFEIYKQTGAFGNAFAFLMGGVVTDYTEIGLLWTNLGKKTALWTVAIAVPQVVLIGWIFNLVFKG